MKIFLKSFSTFTISTFFMGKLNFSNAATIGVTCNPGRAIISMTIDLFPLVNSFSKLFKKIKLSKITKVVKTAKSEEHTSELQSRFDLVCRLLLEKQKHHSQ